MSIIDRLAVVLATGFGLGLSPVASGTVGSLPGLLLAWALLFLPGGVAAQAGAALLLALLAVPVCDRAEKHFGGKDDGRIVADEYLTFPICVLGLPWPAHPWMLGMAFVVARVLDVIKPPPAFQSQRIPGGAGIVADDAIANLYALALNHGLAWAILRLFPAF